MARVDDDPGAAGLAWHDHVGDDQVLGERIGHDVVGDLAIEESLQRSADLGARQVFAGPNLRKTTSGEPAER